MCMDDRESELIDQFLARLKTLVTDFGDETGYFIEVIDGHPLKDDRCYIVGYFRHSSSSSAPAD
jgi:hypothetical protein